MGGRGTYCIFFFFKQKTAYEMRISDWSSDVCSSDLVPPRSIQICQRSSVGGAIVRPANDDGQAVVNRGAAPAALQLPFDHRADGLGAEALGVDPRGFGEAAFGPVELDLAVVAVPANRQIAGAREGGGKKHTCELQ